MSLRGRLFCLILIATLPAALAIAWRGEAETEARTREAHQLAQQQSELLASELARILDGGRRLLNAASKSPSVQVVNYDACTILLAEMQLAVEGSTYLAMLNQQGDVVCGPTGTNANNADRPYFQRAMAAPGLAVGDYAIGRDTGVPTLHIALATHPGIMVAGLSLEWVARMLAERTVPTGTSLLITDRNGIVLARTPNAPERVGGPLPANRQPHVARQDADSVDLRDGDGDMRIIAYAPVFARGEKVMHVEVGLLREPIVASIKGGVRREQAIQAASTALALLLAWIVAERTIRSPVGRLLTTVRAWGAGDLTKRANFGETRTELGELAGTLDSVGDALQKTEATLIAAKEHAEASNQAKTHFLATMSHELRTPLNAVIGFADVISSQLHGPINEQYRESGEEIRRSGTRLLDVINDVLDISKIEAGRLVLDEEAADLDALVQASVRMVQANAEEAGLQIETVRMPGLWVRVDPLRLRQALLNLLSNAIKFSRPNGIVTIETTLAADAGIEISVTDQGIGMSPEQVPVAMKPFGQVESAFARSYEGTGLGLPIAQRIVEAHGGTLTITTGTGSGTMVVISLPAERRVQASARGQPAA